MVDAGQAEAIRTAVRGGGREPLVLVRTAYKEDAPGHEFMAPDAVVVATETALVMCQVKTSGMLKKRQDVRALSTCEYTAMTECRAGTGGAGLKELRFMRDPLEVRLLDIHDDPDWDNMLEVVAAHMPQP